MYMHIYVCVLFSIYIFQTNVLTPRNVTSVIIFYEITVKISKYISYLFEVMLLSRYHMMEA